MATVSKKDLESVFRRLDSKLENSLDLYVIGGASAILGYNIVKQTNDVDLEVAVEEKIFAAFAESARESGVEVDLSFKGVFTPPEGYRERMTFMDFPKKKLRVWVLDQYDLAISKISRGFGKDYDDILRVHRAAPFQYDKLVQIFMGEFMGVANIGNPRETQMNFLDLIEKLFGEEALVKAKADIRY